jgi:ubiquinone/menaquinone biosynthesis C-methylase UbiE
MDAEVDLDLEEKPAWAAGGFVSDVVNMLINSPIYALMKPLARQTLINTAEENGIPWIERKKLLASQKILLEENYDLVDNGSLEYPEYYTQPFHAYDAGNLCWDAAYECESATMSMALRVWPEESLTALEAQNRLRYSFLDAVEEYLGPCSPQRIVDVGCSVGVSTLYVADKFPKAKSIIGYDLSPYFLSVALKRQQEEITASNSNYGRISYVHGNIEDPPASWTTSDKFDLTTASFMFHELPAEPTEKILAKMVEITKAGGVVALTDNNPRSEVIRNLPPAIFTLMKSTEPHSDEYYQFGLERALARLGCTDIKTIPTDPRHRTILARVP